MREQGQKIKMKTWWYFQNCAHSFSSYNLVISGVWERCRAACINIGSGIHHNPCSIETLIIYLMPVVSHDSVSEPVPVTVNISASLSSDTRIIRLGPFSCFMPAWTMIPRVVAGQDSSSRHQPGPFSNKVVTLSTRRAGKEPMASPC